MFNVIDFVQEISPARPGDASDVPTINRQLSRKQFDLQTSN